MAPRRVLLLLAMLLPLTPFATAPAAAAEPASGCTTAGTAVSCRYEFTGAEETFLVPTGVTSLAITAVGGSGGDLADGSPFGGRPAYNARVLAVTPGQTLYVAVGGDGGAVGSPPTRRTPGAGGWNGGADGGPGGFYARGGAGGGGASDVRTVSRSAPGTLGSRVLVAAGGGGSSQDQFVSAHGGDAGQPGESTLDPCRAGQPGTLRAGGAGGVACQTWTPTPAPSGVFGSGGEGRTQAVEFGGPGGGGGGGGWYGGGGGQCIDNAAGGGGGSSFPPANVQVVDEPAYVLIRYRLP